MNKTNQEIKLDNYEDVHSVDLETGKKITIEEQITKELVAQDIKTDNSLSLLVQDSALVEKALATEKQIMEIIQKALTFDIHYGFIQNTTNKTLLQAGADVLARIFGLQIKYEIIDKIVDITNGIIDYTYKATALKQGIELGEATASANSMESKFRGHFQDYDKTTKLWTNKPNKTVYELKNTLDQMAQKRSMVRVVRKVLGITGAFTQDLGDNNEGGIQSRLATKDEKFEIYGNLYIYKTSELGKNEEERKNWLKLHVLKPLLLENGIEASFAKWTTNDLDLINEKLNDKTYVDALIAKAKNGN